MYNWYSSYADLSIPSASVPITKQKLTKPYHSFPNQKSVDSQPSLTSITQIRILSPLHSVTHASYRLLTFEHGIPYIYQYD